MDPETQDVQLNTVPTLQNVRRTSRKPKQATKKHVIFTLKKMFLENHRTAKKKPSQNVPVTKKKRPQDQKLETEQAYSVSRLKSACYSVNL